VTVPIDATERQIPLALSEQTAWSIREMSECLPQDFGLRAHWSQWASSRLRRLEKAGLTARMDGEKPIAWVRTAAGTAAVAEAS
jgi:hypothetical protein